MSLYLLDQGMRKAFVEPVNKQRREMAGNVILYVCGAAHTYCNRSDLCPSSTLYRPASDSVHQCLHIFPLPSMRDSA